MTVFQRSIKCRLSNFHALYAESDSVFRAFFMFLRVLNNVYNVFFLLRSADSVHVNLDALFSVLTQFTFSLYCIYLEK